MNKYFQYCTAVTCPELESSFLHQKERVIRLCDTMYVFAQHTGSCLSTLASCTPRICNCYVVANM